MLRIQCPNCKEWLSVKYTPDMEELMITCPYCRMKSPFKDWKKNDTRRKAEEEERKKREEEERRRQEERIRREEEERQRQEEERIKREVEERKRQEEERIRREEEERKRQEEEAQRRNAEELRRRQEEEEQRRAEESYIELSELYNWKRIECVKEGKSLFPNHKLEIRHDLRDMRFVEEHKDELKQYFID